VRGTLAVELQGEESMAVMPILRGLATYVPLVKRFTNRGSGGTDSARYCYCVWLRHLVALHSAGLGSNWPVVAELGPGDSLGTGIAALLLGANKYCALDAKPFIRNETNLEMFDRLLELFRTREPVPDDREFPDVIPRLIDYSFPASILTEHRLQAALAPNRLAAIRRELAELANQRPGQYVSYFAPWDDEAAIQVESVDLAFSQAVMEHVVNVESTYMALAKWLRPGGCMSHSIDFRSHHTAAEWNGHWRYSDLVWKIIVGRRAYLINREPSSTHLRAIQSNGFDVRLVQRCSQAGGCERAQLAPRFRNLDDDDMNTSVAFVVAQKTSSPSIDRTGPRN
jgi:hypothetical protein